MKAIKASQVLALIAVLIMTTFLLPVVPARAASTIHVNSSADNSTLGDGQCTLREAITNANNDSGTSADCAAGSGTDTIDFAGNYVITLSSALPVITGTLLINGNGETDSVVQASTCDPVNLPGGCSPASYPVFELSEGSSLSLNGLTVRHGKSPDYGGGIRPPNTGTTTINIVNSTLTSNYAASRGGAVASLGGTLTVKHSLISGNWAGNGGGGIEVLGAGTQLNVSNSIFWSNSAASEGGGVQIYNGANASIKRSLFSGNHVIIGGSTGGGIHNFGNLILSNSTISANGAGSSGGGLFGQWGTSTILNSTITGNSATIAGGIYIGVNGTLNYSNTVSADSTSGDDCTNDGTLGTNTNNLVELGWCSAALSGDPQLGQLTSNGGFTSTQAPLFGSPVIDAGDAAACAAAPVSGLDQRGMSRDADGDHDGVATCDIGAYESHNAAVMSSAAEDGWMLESSETSSTAGIVNTAGTIFYLGDNAANQQYRAVLSFESPGLPANAVITAATLKIKRKGLIVGSDPFLTHGWLKVDMKKPYLGGGPSLAVDDFNALAGKSNVAIIDNTATGSWYSASLSPLAYLYINRSGRTQMRLRFGKDDDNDLSADYIKFHSGDATTPAFRPVLIIEYFLP